jgi:hypothetical protein
MNLTPEIINYEAQLNKLLAEVRSLNPADNLYSSMNDYVCIRITGYIETSLDSLLITYTDGATTTSALKNVIHIYISGHHSAKYDKIKEMLGAFDEHWADNFVREIDLENKRSKKDLAQTLNTIFSMRNSIAHGGAASVNITPSSLRAYYESAKQIIRIVARVIP